MLNEYQQAVVENYHGAQVVEACPGSGKTYTLEHRVKKMIDDGVDPSGIGLFTFSVKAAEEMRVRIAKLIWPDLTDEEIAFFASPNHTDNPKKNDPVAGMLINWTCTIHALSYRLLREYGFNLRVLSGKDQWDADQLIKDTIDELDWDESLKSVKTWISNAINNLVTPEESENWFYLRFGNGILASHMATVYKEYMYFMKTRHLVDFDMMQARCILLLRKDQRFRNFVANKFEYIMVDEAQDTSPNQSEILFALAKRSRNICFIGDVDQAMYGFRNANPSILREDFEDVWSEVQRFNLPINYRSTKSIINAATNLILNNYEQGSKYIKPFQAREDAVDGERIQYIESEHFGQTETEVVCVIKENDNPGSWFVLSRTRAECAAIHTALIAAEIPAINKSGGLLFGAPHIKKVLAYMRLACNYHDARNDQEILGEIANVASVYFTAPMTVRKHKEDCHNEKSWVDCGCPVVREEGKDYCHARYYGQKAIQDAGNWQGIVEQQYEKNRGKYPTLRAKGAIDLVKFVDSLEKGIEDAANTINVILEDCMIKWMQSQNGHEENDSSENTNEDFAVLLSLVEEGMSVEQFLDKVEKLTPKSTVDDDKSVLVGTFHWSKGAERPNVVVNTTRLPCGSPQKPGRLPVGTEPTIEEERRLAYVGITRAKEKCILVGSREWMGLQTSPEFFPDQTA